LIEAVGTHGRAIGIGEKEMVKNPAAWPRLRLQTSTTREGLVAVVDAAAFSGNDKQKPLALVQSGQGADAVDVRTWSARGRDVQDA